MPISKGFSIRRASAFEPVYDRINHENHTSYDTTAKVVCESCNNGWMNSLDQRAKPLIYGLAWGHSDEIPKEQAQLFLTWATKVALVRTAFDAEANQQANLQVFHDFYVSQDGYTDALVQVARISDFHVSTHNTSLNALMLVGGRPSIGKSSHTSNMVTISIGNLFFQVGLSSESSWAQKQTAITLAAVRNYLPNKVVRLSPSGIKLPVGAILPDESLKAADGLYLRGIRGYTGGPFDNAPSWYQ